MKIDMCKYCIINKDDCIIRNRGYVDICPCRICFFISNCDFDTCEKYEILYNWIVDNKKHKPKEKKHNG